MVREAPGHSQNFQAFPINDLLMRLFVSKDADRSSSRSSRLETLFFRMLWYFVEGELLARGIYCRHLEQTYLRGYPRTASFRYIDTSVPALANLGTPRSESWTQPLGDQ